jgi:beta-glucosidase
MDERVNELLGRMSTGEKLELLRFDGYGSGGVQRLGVPPLYMTDGPAGIRQGTATAFPVPLALAASWDTLLVKQVGEAIALEAVAKGMNMLLAPNVNIFRNPLSGTNFESFGEDPFLASRMAVSFIRGVHRNDVIACVRDLMAQNQEWGGKELNVLADERTLREVYMPAFRAAVEEAGVEAIMWAPHLLNGKRLPQLENVTAGIAVTEWNFNGVFLKDPLDVQSTEEAGSDTMDMGRIDEQLRRLLWIRLASGMMDHQTDPVLLEPPSHPELALEAALKSIVLLKNHGGLLPLDHDSISSIALIGPNLLQARTGGGGRSAVSPGHAVSPYEGIREIADGSIFLYTAQGVNILHDVAPLDTNHVFIGQGVNGFSAKYYKGTEPSGRPEVFATDKYIDFNWWRFPPCPSLENDFSASWDATLIPQHGGPVKVKIIHNDGCRLLLDGRTIIDAWEEGPVRTDSAWLDIEKGRSYNLQIDYFSDGDGPAQVKFGIDYLEANMIAEAVEKALRADVAIVFAGLSDRFECEGFDRDHWGIPAQSRLIRAVYEANPNTVVVLQTGSPVDIEEWAFDVPAIIQAWYPGQEGGKAIAEVLFGRYNPTGRLPFTWAMDIRHYPAMEGYRSPSMREWYLEGLHPGYRYMDKHNLKARFPFGHGLSYTTFGIGKLLMNRDRSGNGWMATVEVLNMGDRAGTETLQVYIRDTEGSVEKAYKELKAFRQVTLLPWQKETVAIPLPYKAFEYYDADNGRYTIEPGKYQVMVGTSAEDIKLVRTIEIKEEHINQYYHHE